MKECREHYRLMMKIPKKIIYITKLDNNNKKMKRRRKFSQKIKDNN